MKSKKSRIILSLILLTIINLSCAISPKGLKEKTLDDQYLILSEKEYDEIKSCENEDKLKLLVNKFWINKKEEDAEKKENIFLEYSKRLEYANKNFPDKKGWGRSERKRIYLLYGEPAYIEKQEFVDELISRFAVIKSMEVWYYMRPRKSMIMQSGGDEFAKGEMKFIFADMTGSGEYELIYSTEEASDIDARLY